MLKKVFIVAMFINFAAISAAQATDIILPKKVLKSKDIIEITFNKKNGWWDEWSCNYIPGWAPREEFVAPSSVPGVVPDIYRTIPGQAPTIEAYIKVKGIEYNFSSLTECNKAARYMKNLKAFGLKGIKAKLNVQKRTIVSIEFTSDAAKAYYESMPEAVRTLGPDNPMNFKVSSDKNIFCIEFKESKEPFYSYRCRERIQGLTQADQKHEYDICIDKVNSGGFAGVASFRPNVLHERLEEISCGDGDTMKVTFVNTLKNGELVYTTYQGFLEDM